MFLNVFFLCVVVGFVVGRTLYLVWYLLVTFGATHFNLVQHQLYDGVLDRIAAKGGVWSRGVQPRGP